MSTKIKKKTEKVKKKVIKRATLKQAYTEKELVDLKNKYRDIISHLSLFLSEHNVYEAVPENAKLLVFNSELSFYEMIKIFIFEDIYCGLIYDQKINNYIGLITTRDIMILHKYIIDNFPAEKITDFSNYLKTIFSNQKLEQTEHSIEQDSSKDISIINDDINIFKHLTDVNYMQYLKYAIKKEYKNIYMHSALLDDSLLETIMKLNIKHYDRLLVEEERKNGQLIEKDLSENQKNEKIEQNKKVESSETVKTKTRNSKSEKTTTANDSDEENKFNQNQVKKDIKKIIEQNEENIAEEPTNNIKLIREENGIKDKPTKIIKKIKQKNKEEKNVSEGKNNISIKEGDKSIDKPKKKIIKKKIIKKKKNFSDENKTDESNLNDNTNDNIIDNDTSRDEPKPKVKKIVKMKEVKREETLETININELESNKRESLPKRKKIIRRKKKSDESSVLSDQSHTLKESRTDDELAPKSKRIFKKKVKQERRTTFDVPMSKNDDSIKCEKEVIYRDGKKIIRKKIIKKKIIKKKVKKGTIENNIKTYDQNKSTTNEENTIEISDETNNIKSTTGGGDDTQSIVDKDKEKDKYELPKLKMRKITSNKNKNEEEKEKEKENKDKNDANESKEDEKREDNKDKEGDQKKDIIENKHNSDKEKENNDQSKDIETKDDKKEKKDDDINKESQNETKKEEKNNSNINENEIKGNKDENENEINDQENINIDKEKLKKEDDDDEIVANNTLSNVYSKEIKNYLGVVNNDTIFEYLIVNYYSNDMKEFNLSLNELLFLGDTPFIQKLDKGEDLNQKVYNTFNKYLFNNSDIIPINNGKEIVGFIYPKDFFYYLYNCESKQSLTNNDFLVNLYKDVDEEKPYGKNRVIYMELNNKNKEFYIKELLEKLNCSIEKKIVLYEPNDNSKLYLISLKTIFKAIVEFQTKNK